MRSHHVTLTEPLSRVVETQVKSGRYKDFSAAIQEAVWNYFMRGSDPLAEYELTADEVEKAYQRELAGIEQDRKAGKLKAFDL